MVFTLWAATLTTLSAQLLPLQSYTRKEGLISNGISQLYQDSRGYLWIGSAEGISRYDGVNFKNYRTTDGLGHNFITAIRESRTNPGCMWVGTAGGGVSRISGDRIESFKMAGPPEANYVTSLVEDTAGVLWFGTSLGVYRFRDGVITPFLTEGLEKSEVEVLAAKEGTFIFFMRNKFLIYDLTSGSGKLTKLDIPGGALVTSVYYGPGNNLWVGINDSTLWQFADGALLKRHKLLSRSAQDLVDDLERGLWICTDNGLLHLTYDGDRSGEMVRYGVENGLQFGSLNTCLIDREGILWIGGARGGLSKFYNKQLNRFPMESVYSPANNSVAVVDSNGHWWIVAKNGLWEIYQTSSGSWRQHLHDIANGASANEPHGVVLDDIGRLWVGFQGAAMICYRIHSLREQKSELLSGQEFAVSSPAVRKFRQCFIIDRSNRLWSSYDDIGIVVQAIGPREQPERTYGVRENIPDVSVRALLVDRSNNVWAGGYQGGVAVLRYDGKRDSYEKTFSKINGLPDGHIRAMYQDKKGRMWIGTRDGGLVILNKDSLVVLSTSDGLISNTIWSLAGDTDGKIWVGTALGLQCVDGESLKPQPASREFYSDGSQSCGVANGHNLWWASSGEFVVYDYLRKKVNAVPPPVYITRMLVNAKDTDILQGSRLRYDQNLCAFEFAGLSFVDEHRVRYQYRMMGVDERWSEPASDRTVTFASLKPGNYTFEVKAINNDGVASLRPASFAFEIVPPYWQRWWFEALALASVIILLILAYNYRVSKLLEVERTRTRIARDLHDEVGTTLSSISYFAQAIRREEGNRPRSDRFLSRIMTSSNEMQEAISDIIWSIDPANDNWEKLLAKCQRYASDLFESCSIRYKMDFPEAVPLKKLDMHDRRQFWLIFREMVTNTAKHSHCSEATIRFSQRDAECSLVVEDNGVGFDVDQLKHSRGLDNIRHRVTQLNARLTLKTSVNSGTRWCLNFRA